MAARRTAWWHGAGMDTGRTRGQTQGRGQGQTRGQMSQGVGVTLGPPTGSLWILVAMSSHPAPGILWPKSREWGKGEVPAQQGALPALIGNKCSPPARQRGSSTLRHGATAVSPGCPGERGHPWGQPVPGGESGQHRVAAGHNPYQPAENPHPVPYRRWWGPPSPPHPKSDPGHRWSPAASPSW